MGSKITDKNCDPFFAYVSKAYLQYSFEKIAAEASADVLISEEFDKKTRKVLKRADQRASVKKNVLPKAKKLSVIVMLILSVTTCIFAPVQAVQHAVISTVLDWQDKFASVLYSSSNNSALAPVPDNIQINYLPAGFDELIIDEVLPDKIVKCYANADNDLLYVSVYKINTSKRKDIDNETRDIITINFGDITGIISFESDKVSNLVWEENDLLFTISATLSINELIKIAENINYD